MLQANSEQYQIELGVRSTIYCLAYDKNLRLLAVGIGSEVYTVREVSQSKSMCDHINAVEYLLLQTTTQGHRCFRLHSTAASVQLGTVPSIVVSDPWACTSSRLVVSYSLVT